MGQEKYYVKLRLEDIESICYCLRMPQTVTKMWNRRVDKQYPDQDFLLSQLHPVATYIWLMLLS